MGLLFFIGSLANKGILGEFLKALTSIPAFWVLRFINTWFVTKAFWNEVVGKRSVKVFEKGH